MDRRGHHGKVGQALEMHGEKITEAVSKVTWTANDGKGIRAGFFQKFPLSLGQLPEDTDELVFKALQTYSNKEVVRWIEVQKDGAEEPDNPAPVLALSAATEDHHGGASTTGESAAASAEPAEQAAAKTTTTAAEPADSSDTTARVLGVVGIVVGVAGVAYGVAGRRRTTV